MSIVNRIKCKPAAIDWGEWALPLEVYTYRRGFAVRLLVFEVTFWIVCDHKWKVYHRHGKAYRRCLRPNCKVWETLAESKES